MSDVTYSALIFEIDAAPPTKEQIATHLANERNVIPVMWGFTLLSFIAACMTFSFSSFAFTTCAMLFVSGFFIIKYKYKRLDLLANNLDYITGEDCLIVSEWASIPKVEKYLSQLALVNREMVRSEFYMLQEEVRSHRNETAKKTLYGEVRP